MKKNKRCCVCDKQRLLKFFNKRHDGRSDGYRSLCKDCDLLNGRISYHKRKDPQYRKIPCDICGAIYDRKGAQQIRCKPCKKIYGRIHASLTNKRHNSTKTLPCDNNSVIEVTKRYLATNECIYCRRQFTDTNTKSLDHIIPVKNGGVSHSSNINICCQECNQSKAYLALDKWIELSHIIAQTNPLQSS